MNLSDLKVMIGIPSYKDATGETQQSLRRTLLDAQGSGLHVEMAEVHGSAVITAARSEVVRYFLSTDCNRLFWIDSDIEWTVQDFATVLSLSAQRDIVGVTYPAKREDMPFFVKCDGLMVHGAIPIDMETGCLEVEGLGLGFTCMSREAVEAVANTKPWVLDEQNGTFQRDVFRIDTYETGDIAGDDAPEEIRGKPIIARRGEDMAFFADCRAAGYKVWLCPWINLGHVGKKTYRGNLVKALGMPE